MQPWQHSKNREQSAICIIEDITSDWVDEIGYNMDLDPRFFVRHFNKNWDNRSHSWHWTVEPDKWQRDEEAHQWRFIDASFALPRHLRGEPVRTRISYHRIQKMCTCNFFHAWSSTS